jgi:hypothetical protein
MNFDVSDQPAIVVMVVLVVACSPLIWFAARMVEADTPTLPRSMVTLLVGTVGSLTVLALFGGRGLALAPLVFLLSIRYVLGTTFFGALVVAVVASIAYTGFAQWAGEDAVMLPRAMTVWSCGDAVPLDRFGCTEN